MTTSRNHINRRRFIKLGATASGAAVAGCGADGGARASAGDVRVGRRQLGGTGLQVSEITFGGDGPENPELLLAAVDLGINTIWTSPEYRDGRAQESVGRAIRAAGRRRDDMVMFTGMELTKITSNTNGCHVPQCCIVPVEARRRAPLRPTLFPQGMACPGVVLDLVLASAGMSGFAFGYAVTNNGLSRRLRSLFGGPPGTRTRDHRIKSPPRIQCRRCFSAPP